MRAEIETRGLNRKEGGSGEQAFTLRHLIAGAFHEVTHSAGSGNRESNSGGGDGVHETRLPRI